MTTFTSAMLVLAAAGFGATLVFIGIRGAVRIWKEEK